MSSGETWGKAKLALGIADQTLIMPAMIRIALATLSAMLATSLSAQEEVPLDELVRKNTAEALSKLISDPRRPGKARISQMFQVGGGIVVCATSDAYNRSGSVIGWDYWEVRLSKDGSEVVGARNVTGLLSDCYGVDYAPFGELSGDVSGERKSGRKKRRSSY